MKKPIGTQLYSVRNELDKDFEGTLRKLAAMGFDGVELAGLPKGVTPQAAVALLKELKLAVVGGHMALPLGDQKNQVIEAAKALGCKTIINSKSAADFKTLDLIKQSCEQFNEAGRNATQAGLRLAVHNHWYEFEKIGDRLVFDVMLEHLAPEVLFEIDTYWARTAGADPAAAITRLGARAPLIHIKDGPCVLGQPMVAAGTGAMKFPPILKAAQHAEWLVVELDACATDMMDAMRNSLAYLRANT
jgi:sugar phosphate isomerase/epimerase